MGREAAFTVIELNFVMQAGYLFISSPQVPGLHLCGADARAVCDDVIPAVKALLRLNCGWNEVEVVPETDASAFPSPARKLEVPVGKQVERLIAYASNWAGNDKRAVATA